MAHVKAGGKARQHSQRPGKRLGVKKFGGEIVKNGMILVRQRGAQFHPGIGTKMGKDFSIYAISEGKVSFRKLKGNQMVEVINQN